MSARLACFALVALLLAGCGGASASGPTLQVYAASSLTEAFRDLEGSFEEANPGVDVALTFAGSQVLRLQIEQGAPADVFASADPEHMQRLLDAGLAVERATLASNALVVIVPLDNPAGIETFADLPKAERLVVGSDHVPVGRYTRDVLRRASGPLGSQFEADVLASVVSQENNVRQVRAKVELGEADAAIVYRTDAVASERVRMVPVPANLGVRATYPIAVVDQAGQPDLARRWLEFVLSERGQATLRRHGFVDP